MWTAEDRDGALWWLIRERAKCPSCGTRPDEWDPAKGGHDHAYVHELHRCYGCAEKAKGQKQIDDAKLDHAWVAMVRNPEAIR